jgi:hypothetical protein
MNSISSPIVSQLKNFQLTNESHLSQLALHLSINIPNHSFYNFALYNLSNQTCSTLVVLLSDGTTNRYKDKPVETQLSLNIDLSLLDFTAIINQQLQIISYHQLPGQVEPSSMLEKLKELILEHQMNTYQILCEDEANQHLQYPIEACGGIISNA